MIIRICTPTCKEILAILILFPLLPFLLPAELFPAENPLPILIAAAILRLIAVAAIHLISRYPLAGGDTHRMLAGLTAALCALIALILLNYLSGFLSSGEPEVLFPPSDTLTQSMQMLLLMLLGVTAEELTYRNFLLQAFDRISLSRTLAIILSAMAFAAGHIYMGLDGIIFSFTSALVLGFVFYRYGGVYISTAVHLAYNLLVLFANGYF